jgi:lantibiotic transport system permease protein
MRLTALWRQMTPSYSEVRRALGAEVLKLRRTLAFRLMFIVPLLIVLLQTGVYTRSGEAMESVASPLVGFERGIVTLWTLVFLPFYATLVTALIAAFDHADHCWDQLFALPLRRAGIYAAKWLAATALVVSASAIMAVVTIAAAELLKIVHPAWAAKPVSFVMPVDGAWRSSAAALFLIAIQFWASIRWRSFIGPIALGIAGIMSGIILIQAPLAVLSAYPWTAPAAAASPTRPGSALLCGALAGVVIAILACYSLASRDT